MNGLEVTLLCATALLGVIALNFYVLCLELGKRCKRLEKENQQLTHECRRLSALGEHGSPPNSKRTMWSGRERHPDA